MNAPKCPWCGAENAGPTLLCPECEAEAVHRRLAAGLTVRHLPSAQSDTDD